ncbi:MAG: T9SS type A sorting domain-containing protein [Saprospiraceae bacterium]
MKTYLFILSCFPFFLFAQTPDNCRASTAFRSFSSELVSAGMGTGGDLFLTEDQEHLRVKSNTDEQMMTTIFAAGLVAAGYNADGNIAAAWSEYGRTSVTFDYAPGYLDLTEGTDDPEKCLNWDRVWYVNGNDIRAHLQEIAAHSAPLTKRPDLYAYPAQGNPHFLEFAGFNLPNLGRDFAPYYDANGDAIYNPDSGDYPLPANVDRNAVPDEMMWMVFNDYDQPRSNLISEPLGLEIQLTAFRYDCTESALLNRTIFTQHKIINRTSNNIDSLAVGSWIDFDIGHSTDDYLGTAPEINTFYAYNSDENDGRNNAANFNLIEGTELPVSAVTFLNQSLEYTMPYTPFTTTEPPLPINVPRNPASIFNYLNGKWYEGSRLTVSGFGFNPDSINYSNHIFPDNPNDPDGWSAINISYPEGEIRGFASKQFGTLGASGIIRLDQAWSFHQGAGNDHLENVDLMYEQIPMLQQIYNNQFAGLSCVTTAVENTIASVPFIDIFPNPATDNLTIKSEDLNIQHIEIIDLQGRIHWSKNVLTKSVEVKIDNLPAQVYFIKTYTDNGMVTKRFIKL